MYNYLFKKKLIIYSFKKRLPDYYLKKCVSNLIRIDGFRRVFILSEGQGKTVKWTIRLY